ncbi:MAG: DNA-binding response regulator [Chitinophagaceae bacterium]|nr:DNA-binding response regulator [Chitinophagaceae bacterium]
MKKIIRCAIIEDEPLAQNVLRKYISDCPLLELTAVCNDAMEAQPVLADREVQLIFLDINLPGLSGISFLKTLTHSPLVILTTAYPEFAVVGFELDAIDYLLKPFSFERFLKAVNKALTRLDGVSKKIADEKNMDPFIFLKAGKKVHKIDFEKILYLEATGDYVKVFTSDSQYIVNNTLKSLQEELPYSDFIRVHKSYIISRDKIKFVEGNYIKIGNIDIPIGAAYRDDIFGWLKEKNK